MAGHGDTSTTSGPPSPDVSSGASPLLASSTVPILVPDMACSAGEALDQLLTAHWAGQPQLQAMGEDALEEYCIGSSV